MFNSPTLRGFAHLTLTIWSFSVAQETKCLTPETIFHTAISDRSIFVKADLPFKLDISEEEAATLERLLHNSIEVVLSRYFKIT